MKKNLCLSIDLPAGHFFVEVEWSSPRQKTLIFLNQTLLWLIYMSDALTGVHVVLGVDKTFQEVNRYRWISFLGLLVTVLQTGWPKTVDVYCPWRLKVWNQGVGKAMFPLKLWVEFFVSSFELLGVAGNPWHSSDCNLINPSFSLFLKFFWPCCIACEILVPDQGVNLGPRQWKPRVLTTGPPGNAPH